MQLILTLPRFPFSSVSLREMYWTTKRIGILIVEIKSLIAFMQFSFKKSHGVAFQADLVKATFNNSRLKLL